VPTNLFFGFLYDAARRFNVTTILGGQTDTLLGYVVLYGLVPGSGRVLNRLEHSGMIVGAAKPAAIYLAFQSRGCDSIWDGGEAVFSILTVLRNADGTGTGTDDSRNRTHTTIRWLRRGPIALAHEA
jgi:hypothetical protein